MARFTAVRQPSHTNDSTASALILSTASRRYLQRVRKLFAAYQRAHGGEQRQIFVRMIHAFMRVLCGYPPTGYVVTTASSRQAEVGSYPHVIPTLFVTNATLFYFTSSEDPDDVHDLWVKQAQVYLMHPPQGDVAAACADQVVFTNFFLIDGASKEPTTGAWHCWSVSDIPAAPLARIDLRYLEDATDSALMTPDIVHQRLQTLQYQLPSEIREPAMCGSEALAALLPKASMEAHGS